MAAPVLNIAELEEQNLIVIPFGGYEPTQEVSIHNCLYVVEKRFSSEAFSSPRGCSFWKEVYLVMRDSQAYVLSLFNGKESAITSVCSRLKTIDSVLDTTHEVYPEPVQNEYQNLFVLRTWDAGNSLYCKLDKPKSAGEVRTIINYLQEKMLEPLHRIGIVHGNLTPENIFLGLGTSYHCLDYIPTRETAHASYLATHSTPACYMSPKRENAALRTEDDLYSLARIAYYLLTGEQPMYFQDPRLAREWDQNSLLAAVPPSAPFLRATLSDFVRGVYEIKESKVETRRISVPSHIPDRVSARNEQYAY